MFTVINKSLEKINKNKNGEDTGYDLTETTPKSPKYNWVDIQEDMYDPHK